MELRHRTKISFAVVLLAGLFFAGRLFADVERCAICGGLFGNEIYTITDKVTDEKKKICASCASLRHDCFICGLPVKDNYTELPDGRYCCARDSKDAVLDEPAGLRLSADVVESLERLFSRFTSFPNTNVSFAMIDRVHLQELFKFSGNDYVCPNVLGYYETKTNRGQIKHEVNLLSALPAYSFKSTCAHELGHAWMHDNVSPERMKTLHHDAIEGFCELVSYLLAESQGDEAAKKSILLNLYTRGQIHLFIDSERRFGFNDVVDWIKYGVDDRLKADEPNRLRDVKIPKGKTKLPPNNKTQKPETAPKILITP